MCESVNLSTCFSFKENLVPDNEVRVIIVEAGYSLVSDLVFFYVKTEF